MFILVIKGAPPDSSKVPYIQGVRNHGGWGTNHRRQDRLGVEARKTRSR